MDFKKKMKINMIYYAALVALGAAFIVLRILGYMPDIFISFGCAYAACGLAMLIKNGIIISNPEKLKKLEIESKDERNRMIYGKAVSLAFNIFIYAAAAAIMALEFAGMSEAGLTVALCLCGFVLIYVVCYYILRARS